MKLINFLYLFCIPLFISCSAEKAAFSFNVENEAFQRDLPFKYESRVYISNKKGKVISDQELIMGEVLSIDNFNKNEIYDLTFHTKIIRIDDVSFSDRLATFFNVKPTEINFTNPYLDAELGLEETDNILVFADSNNIDWSWGQIQHSEKQHEFIKYYRFLKGDVQFSSFEKMKDVQEQEVVLQSNVTLDIINKDPGHLEFSTNFKDYSYFIANFYSSYRGPNRGGLKWILYIPESMGNKTSLPAIANYEPANLDADRLKNLRLQKANLMRIEGEEIIGRLMNEYDPDERHQMSAWYLFDKFEMVAKMIR